ncbi:MAG: protein kinase [Anaerolineae bacterium]|nr:protein kinase [Anaerolineae bacterium]NUQ02777.1 protein kinase [Anaerolineae bacterium]
MASETILNGRYRLIAQQGSGGMAVIYKAIDQMLGRQVAIKILRPSLTADPSFLARFRNEARSVANLQHPNIVTVYDVGQDGPTHYIVMEFVDGSDLKKAIKTEGALPIIRAIKLGIQLCAGIGFAHRAGLVHADVKPQNILVTRDDMVKVTDFGIAQALTTSQPGERQAVVWGSPHYFAPEQARGERPTPASDVYSIGIVLFELLTGRLPFSGQNQQELAMAHIRDPIPLATDHNPAVPESLARIVYKTMSKEPEQRYRMADQLKSILEGLIERGGAEQLSSSLSAPPGNTSPTIASSGKGSGNERQATPPPVSQPGIPLPPYSTKASGWQGAQMPPPPSGSTPLPRGVEPLPPTQRVDLAPSAPAQPFAAQRPAFGGATHQPTAGGQPFSGNTSQLYPPAANAHVQPPQRVPPALDVVTILLAMVAFMAVACLIPLYILVFQARFAG